MAQTRVAVFGAGAVGSYLGSRLATARADVHFIARGAHLQALRERGLTLIGADGINTIPVYATDTPAAIGRVDLVLFCVKSYDTEAAADQLGPLIGPGTVVLSVQNGIENEAKIAAKVGAEHVLGGDSIRAQEHYEEGAVKGHGTSEVPNLPSPRFGERGRG